MEKKGIINKGEGIGTFLTTAIPLGGLSPEEQAQQQEFYPVRNFLGQAFGTVASFIGIGGYLNAPKLVKTGESVRKGGKIIEETFRRDPGRLTQIGVDLGRKISKTKRQNTKQNKQQKKTHKKGRNTKTKKKRKKKNQNKKHGHLSPQAVMQFIL